MSKMVPNVYYRLRWLGPISHMLTQFAGSFWIKMFALIYKPLKLVWKILKLCNYFIQINPSICICAIREDDSNIQKAIWRPNSLFEFWNLGPDCPESTSILKITAKKSFVIFFLLFQKIVVFSPLFVCYLYYQKTKNKKQEKNQLFSGIIDCWWQGENYQSTIFESI